MSLMKFLFKNIVKFINQHRLTLFLTIKSPIIKIIMQQRQSLLLKFFLKKKLFRFNIFQLMKEFVDFIGLLDNKNLFLIIKLLFLMALITKLAHLQFNNKLNVWMKNRWLFLVATKKFVQQKYLKYYCQFAKKIW